MQLARRLRVKAQHILPGRLGNADHCVGLLDADITGPNVPLMLGMKTQLATDGQKILPAEKYGLQVVSMGFLTNDDAPVIWRGPMLHGVIKQFFMDVRWKDLDYLIVDLPPEEAKKVRPISAANLAAKCATSAGISSARSASEGTATGTTLSR